MYKHSIVIGKFLPPHRGHLYMIDSASSFSLKTTLLVYTLPTEPIPGWMRFEALESHYKGTNVTVKWIEKDLPQEPKGSIEEQKEFWRIWNEQILSDVDSPIDAVFGSEDYVYRLADDLGAEAVIISTMNRDIVPMSGTALRDSMVENWEYLIPEMKKHLRKKICVVGGESCGKTTLCRLLSNALLTDWMPEYGREYAETKVGEWTSQDFTNIAIEHLKQQEKASDKARHVLVVDTDPIVTQCFHILFLGERSPDLDKLIEASDYDHYIVLPPMVNFHQDGNRVFGEKRDLQLELILSELRKWKRSYTVLPESDMRKRIRDANEIVSNINASFKNFASLKVRTNKLNKIIENPHS